MPTASSCLFVDGGAADEDLPHLEVVVVLGGDGEVGVVGGGPELVARHHEEDERRHLAEHLVQPLVLQLDGGARKLTFFFLLSVSLSGFLNEWAQARIKWEIHM